MSGPRHLTSLGKQHQRQNRFVILSISTTAAAILLLLPLLCSSAAATSADSPTYEVHCRSAANLGKIRWKSIGSTNLGYPGNPALRRRLIGSSPPTCRSKCGRCRPCVSVDVPIQPGVSVPLEYYPEAWRCKCGNKLYMP